ncbi:MAG: hypothetical protein SFV54_00015 [Bryobacteraceae bacterium]|nr:hypothetical protein [Bryobacteraceae bacterium]
MWYKRTIFVLIAELVVLYVLIPGIATADNRPIRTVDIPVEFDGLNSFDAWSNGYWVMYRRSRTPGLPPQVWSFDREGNVAIPRTDIAVPDAYHCMIHAVAADAAGNIILSLELWSHDGKIETAIAKLTRSRSLSFVSRTDRFLPIALAVAPAGSIWAFCTSRITPSDPREDRELVQQFDENGRLRSSALKQSMFGVPFDPTVSHNSGGPMVVATSTRTGIYSSGARYWAEFDADGKLRTGFKVQLPVGPNGETFAEAVGLGMTADDTVYAWFVIRRDLKDTSRPAAGLYRLDRARRTWAAVSPGLYDSQYGGLYGVDGRHIILRSGCCRYGWFDSHLLQSGQQAP